MQTPSDSHGSPSDDAPASPFSTGDERSSGLTTTKHIFVTGGVVSSLGKGLTAASLGNLLTARGLRVVMQKLDPYLNVDPGTMNPFQHGEVFVTDDGAETDLDIGHYERFLDEDRQYTMAYYRGDPATTSLEKAQLDKKAHLAAKMYVQPGQRILDIGCGWGGFALYLARHYDVEVTGVALAPDQIAFCQERAEEAGLAELPHLEQREEGVH